MRYLFYFIILLLIFCSCHRTISHPSEAAYKDTVINKYLQYLEDLGESDTNDLNYQILKAYTKNDTTYFIKLNNDIEENKKFRTRWDILDSCIHQPKVEDLNTHSAYRFIYGSAFCPYRINITITNKEASTNLHFILYQYKWDTASCRIINEYDKSLSNKNWEDFIEAMEKADFWGLKKDNGHHGVDGDDFKVWGFQKENIGFSLSSRSNYVERWLISKSGLGDPFYLLLKFSGNKQGCLWVQ